MQAQILFLLLNSDLPFPGILETGVLLRLGI